MSVKATNVGLVGSVVESAVILKSPLYYLPDVTKPAYKLAVKLSPTDVRLDSGKEVTTLVGAPAHEAPNIVSDWVQVSKKSMLVDTLLSKFILGIV